MISFGAPFQLTQLSSLVGGFSQLFSSPVLAPLWATYTGNSAIYYRVTQDTTILSRVSTMVANANSAFANYQPQYAVVVTWEDAITSISSYLVS